MLSGHDVDLAKSGEGIDSKDNGRHSKDIDSKNIKWIKWMKIKKGEKNSYSNKKMANTYNKKKILQKQRKQENKQTKKKNKQKLS